MHKRINLILLIIILISFSSSIANAYSYEINKKLASCTPSSNLRIDSTTSYRILGINNSICNLKIISCILLSALIITDGAII